MAERAHLRSLGSMQLGTLLQRLRTRPSIAGALVSARLLGRATLVHASLRVTDRCNLRCRYCSLPLFKTAELTTEQWVSIIDELASLGCRRITFLGGEPLLRTDLGALAAAAWEKGIACAVTSNGLLVRKRLADLGRVENLILSLDAPSPANDAARGEGTFAAVEDAIEAATHAGLPVTINAVISASTVEFLDAMIDFAAHKRCALTVNLMRFGNPELWREAEQLRLTDGQIRGVLERLARLARQLRHLKISSKTYEYAARWPNYERDRLEEHEISRRELRAIGAPRCQAGRRFLCIAPDGGVFPCPVTRGQIDGGNAVAIGVHAAWQNLQSHRCVACYSPCLAEVNYLYSLSPRVLWELVCRGLPRRSWSSAS